MKFFLCLFLIVSVQVLVNAQEQKAVTCLTNSLIQLAESKPDIADSLYLTIELWSSLITKHKECNSIEALFPQIDCQCQWKAKAQDQLTEYTEYLQNELGSAEAANNFLRLVHLNTAHCFLTAVPTTYAKILEDGAVSVLQAKINADNL